MSETQLAEQLEACQRLKAEGALGAATAAPLAEVGVAALLAAWQHKLEPPRDAVTLLCEIATANDEQVQHIGAQALFAQVIEPLNDSFSHSACAMYDQLFAQVISFCRQLPVAAEFNETLKRFGLIHEEDLHARKARLLRTPRYQSGGQVRKIILLSRVTIGADVAINGVLVTALRARFPRAEIVLLGSSKLQELFGGDLRVRVRALKYERGGGLLTRLIAWLAVVAAVAEEGRQCWQDDPQYEMLVLDPDSRLTQLGLLPVVAGDHHYFYFESRSYEQMSAASLAQLTARWASEIFDTRVEVAPTLALLSAHTALGKALRTRWCRANDWLITVSWGVGGNARKRLSATFETALLLNLCNGIRWSESADEKRTLALPPGKLILDKGGNETERAQINQLLEQLRVQGKTILELNEQNVGATLAQETLVADLITWDGGIGALAGLIAASDAYVGYDSAGQHLAAALGVATLTLFVNGNTPLFAARWRPCGDGKLATININAKDWEKDNVTAETLLQRVRQGLHGFGLQPQKPKAQE